MLDLDVKMSGSWGDLALPDKREVEDALQQACEATAEQLASRLTQDFQKIGQENESSGGILKDAAAVRFEARRAPPGQVGAEVSVASARASSGRMADEVARTIEFGSAARNVRPHAIVRGAAYDAERILAENAEKEIGELLR